MWETIEGVDVALYDEAIEARTDLLDALQAACTTRDVRAKTWRKLIEAIEQWPRDAMWRHVALPIAAHHAPRWPRQGVEAHVPNAWILRAARGEEVPELALAHHLLLGPAQVRAPDVVSERAVATGLTRLATHGALAHTYALRLVGFGDDVDAQAWAALLDASTTPALRQLTLYACPDASPIIEALAAGDALDRAHTLELEHCTISGDALKALARAPHGDALRHMKVKHIRGDLLDALAALDDRAGTLPHLRPPTWPGWLIPSDEDRARALPWLSAAHFLLADFDFAERYEREALFAARGWATPGGLEP